VGEIVPSNKYPSDLIGHKTLYYNYQVCGTCIQYAKTDMYYIVVGNEALISGCRSNRKSQRS